MVVVREAIKVCVDQVIPVGVVLGVFAQDVGLLNEQPLLQALIEGLAPARGEFSVIEQGIGRLAHNEVVRTGA